MKAAVLTVACCTLLLSCAHKAEHVDMGNDRYMVGKYEIKRLVRQLSKPININSVQDNRLDKRYLGKFNFSTVYGHNFSDWIQSRFAQLETLSLESPSEVNHIDLNVSIERAYIRTLPSSLGASVVFNVSYFCSKNELEKSALFRGDSTTVNWAFGHSEIMDVLNKSVTRAMDDMVLYLEEDCSKNMTHLNGRQVGSRTSDALGDDSRANTRFRRQGDSHLTL